ncbi:LysM peptidoglycan-binding domain-containing protein [Acinetobacter guerrae]|uniref:LysM peptidoglycan-binding domain-containing protein n=1 Tax=Acinetobacter guerrae TaxID=1843371 RepID=A0A3A8EIR1_9GAMM|nr:LysM peptidoglycan-binding domain-containing protein [Acinetobacter guerrae]RKG33366.1 LysM peptidoglycan-binding domain-containing protein [Acinetobacter guerrae]
MYKPTNMVWQFPAASLFKITILASALAAMGLTTGCSSTPQTAKTKTSKQVGSGYLDASSLDSLEDLLSATDMRAVEGDRLLILKHGDVWKRMTVGFKMDLNHWDPRIEAQRSWFISRQPYLDRLSARASRYLYHTVKEAERRGIPTELALLPVIESSYDPAATSSAAAAGLWQFIPSTGRIYGLKQTSQYDGRRDVVESTRAAYEFLGSLYNQFGSWELALAAYNAGPGRIQQAINRNQAAGLPTDYWSLKLPQETMNYVPRFLAVAQIIKNPKAYNVNLPPIANRPHFREVTLGAPVDLNQIASLTGLSRTELYALNPGYRGERIDPESPMRILIPADVNPSVDAKLKALKASSGFWASNTTTPAPNANVTVSTSTRGSTQTVTPSRTQPPVMTASSSSRPSTTSNVISSITRPLKTTPRSADELAAFAASADIPSAPRIPVAVTPATNVKAVSAEPPISKAEREQIVTLVKQEGGKETVKQALEPQPTQAEKDQVVAELKAIAPKGTEIVDPYDGKIRLTAIQTSQSVADTEGKEVTKGFAYPKAVAETVSADSYEAQNNQGKPYIKTDTDIVVVQPSGKRSTYTVQAGDTLAIIAAKNGVSWRDIAKWNQIDPNNTLFVGASLYLYDAKPQAIDRPSTPKPEVKPESYTVKANDNLTGVADQFGLTVKQLADYNNLSVTSGLFVGQKLALKDNTTSRNAHTITTSRNDVKTNEAKSTRVATKSYTVKRGEYLKLIADRYALSNQELADLTSGLTATSNLNVGQKINVPLHEVTAQDSDKAETKESRSNASSQIKTENYQVQRGDTLSSIASKSKMSLAELASLNNIAANSGVRVGQTLKIPAGSTTPEQYTVQAGDSLNSVANKFDLELADLAELNGLSRNAGLRVGQRLKLTGEISPSAKVELQETSPETHTVKSGETLASIASRYHLQLNYLAALNGLSRNSNVRVGQKLKITGDLPKPETAKEDSPKASSKSKASANTESYTVKSGESLNSIASRLGMSAKDLADLNNLNARASLQRGQSLQIPKTITEYTVKRGDTLIGLASKFGMAIAELADLNDLKQNAQLRIGDVIKVPNL